MSSFTLFMALILSSIAMASKCPDFQAVIPLRDRTTAHNWAFAVVADGKYHLLKTKDKSQELLDQRGEMPTGFERDSLTTVIDRSECADRLYYLITIKVIIGLGPS